MCGFAAIHAYGPAAAAVDADELLRMRERMSARGPDGEGLWLSGDGRVGLAHRRLAIIDLSESGAQPMASADGRLQIIFNGEIYNYLALRDALSSRGYPFRSHSDTEVLLALYAERGPSMLDALRGMFAFAIWDSRERCLFLARDAYGIKPLYYADDGQVLRVASQVQALRAGGGISATADPAGLAGFYLFGTVPEPFTALQAVRALPAGCWLEVRDGRVGAIRRWFSLAGAWRNALADSLGDSGASDDGLRRPGRVTARVTSRRGPAICSPEADVEAMGDALRDAVRHHLVADVPVGAFLSSGIDSGALVGLMAECGQAPTTLTVAFDEFSGTAQDEAPLAAVLAAHYGASHRVLRVTEARFRVDWPSILAAMDQPSIDGVNIWYASAAAREADLKVAVSGLGGDELFGGYPAFQDLPRWTRWLGLPSRIPGLGRVARDLGRLFFGGRLSPKALSLLEYGGTWPGAWLLRRGLFMPWELPALMGEEQAREGLARLAPLDLIAAAMTPDPGTAFGRVAALEAALYMRHQLLRDADWASMAHGVEMRVPLVDTHLLRRIAPLMLRSGGGDMGKQALARAPRKPLPDAVRQRPKTGFVVPFADWLGRIDGLDVWRSVPFLAQPGCHWSRRLAYALAQHSELWPR